MAVLIGADLHLTDNPRDRYRHGSMRRLIRLIRKRMCAADYVVILGDLTELKDHHGAWLTNAIANYIKEITEVCPVLVLQGNHDYEADPDSPFFQFLQHIAGVRWIGRPISVSAFAGLGKVFFLPHSRNPKKDWKDLPLKEQALVFAHNTFEGSITEHGHRLSGVPTTYFHKAATVISGDIHRPQRVGPVTYVGAPWTVDFGDDYEPRVLYMQKLTKIEEISLVAWPQKKLIKASIHNGKLRFNAPDLVAEDVVKVNIRLRRKDAERWIEYREEVRKELTSAGAHIHAIVPEFLTEAPVDAPRLDAVKAKSDRVILKEYGSARSVPERTLKVGEDML